MGRISRITRRDTTIFKIRAANAGVVIAGALLLCIVPCTAQASDQDLAKIENIVVIYAENRSFDHLNGHFPGANGISTFETSTRW